MEKLNEDDIFTEKNLKLIFWDSLYIDDEWYLYFEEITYTEKKLWILRWIESINRKRIKVTEDGFIKI